MATGTPNTVSFTAHNVYEGGALTFDWLIYDQSGNSITDPSQVRVITIYSNTQDPDGAQSVYTSLTSGELVASNGTLVNQYTLSGYTTGVEYSTQISAYILDASLTPLSVHKVQSDYLNKKVRGAIGTITPSISLTPGDESVTVTFSSNTISTFNNYIANNLYTQFNILDYAQMYANVLYNNGTGISGEQFYWADILGVNGTGNTATLTGLVNGVSYEVFAQLSTGIEYIAGDSLSSPGLGAASVVVPTNLPNPPVTLAAVSTLEYNRDVSGQSQYTVTDASSVTLLFQASQETAANTTSYKIFRFDVSGNGYSQVNSGTQIATIQADASGAYLYGSTQGGQSISGGEVLYKYKYVDTAVTVGKYYGYYIVAHNANGDGLPSDSIGVRVGQKAAAPGFSLLGTSGALIANVPSYPNGISYGGFDASSTFYVNVVDPSSNVTRNPYVIDSSNNITISGLTNGSTYTVSMYAVSTNNQYTTPGTDVSSNNTGNTLYYLGNISSSQSLAPYNAPPAPTSVTAVPDISGVTQATGHVYVSWVGDSSYNTGGNTFPIGFLVTRYDASLNGTIVATLPPAQPGSPPAVQYYTDGTTLAGSSYTYKVQQYYVINNTRAVSAYSSPSASVVPFTNPSAPSSLTAYSSGTNVIFTVGPSSSSGGLTPLYYHASISDPSGTPYNQDVSANVQYTVNLQPNKTYTVTVYAYVQGYPGATNYLSTTLSSVLQPTVALPTITTRSIDASGRLVFTTSNNGSILNFAEAIIIDSSGTLNLSLSTNLSTTAQYMTVVSNTTSASTIIVNFNDPAIPRPQSDPANTLIVIANSVGAAVYNTL